MLEADVILRGQGTENQTDTPVMAHPPDTDSDITLQQWMERVLDTQKGITFCSHFSSLINVTIAELKPINNYD